MSFFEFPHARTYDSDLGWLIKKYNELSGYEKDAAASAESAAESATAADASASKAAASATNARNSEQYVVNRTAVLDARLSEAISGLSPTDSELQDIRVWYNGRSSLSAGDAVRGQIGMSAELIPSAAVTASLSDKLAHNYDMSIAGKTGDRIAIKLDYTGEQVRSGIMYSVNAGAYTKISIDNFALVRTGGFYVGTLAADCTGLRFAMTAGTVAETADLTVTAWILDERAQESFDQYLKLHNYLKNGVDLVRRLTFNDSLAHNITVYANIPSGTPVKVTMHYSGTEKIKGLLYLMRSESDYITFNSYGRTYIAGTSVSYMIAPEDFTMIRYAMPAGAKNGTFTMTVTLNGQEPPAELVAGKDYATVTECCTYAADGPNRTVTIHVPAGTWTNVDTIKALTQTRYLNIIGEGCDKTILKSTSASYSDTNVIAVEGIISDIRFVKEASAAVEQGYAYAVHDDANSTAASTTYRNCVFESNAGPAMGLGLRGGKTKRFENCKFLSTSDGTYGHAALGAFYAHNDLTQPQALQQLIVSECVSYNQHGTYGENFDIVSAYPSGTIILEQKNSASFGSGGAAIDNAYTVRNSFNNVPSL